MLVGGQGVRGGDPVETPEVTKDNCCPFYLRSGFRYVETLRHTIFDCADADN